MGSLFRVNISHIPIGLGQLANVKTEPTLQQLMTIDRIYSTDPILCSLIIFSMQSFIMIGKHLPISYRFFPTCGFRSE
jgi:hypothetical protein